MSDCCQPPLLDRHAGAALRARQRRVLWMVLGLNATMLVIEIIASWYAGSTALLADALDFFADSATYGITLFVLARSARWKAAAALVKGLAMGAFGLAVIALALTRALDPALPEAAVMGGVGALALAANAGSALLLYWHRGDDLNMRSVWLCSRNDAIANIAVILAAGAVAVTATAWPDIAAGALIAGLELSAAYAITRQALSELEQAKARLPA